MKTLFLMALFLPSALFAAGQAREITFKTKGFYYRLRSSPKTLSLTGHLIDLSLVKKNCNKRLIASFHKELNEKLRVIVTTKDGHYTATIDSKEHKIAKDSKLGAFLYALPNTMKAIKRKESFLCK